MISKKQKLKATRDSIRHWMLDIRKPFLKGDRILKGNFHCDCDMKWVSSRLPVKRYDTDCALCRLANNNCANCSLMKTTGGCKGNNSTYAIFFNTPNLQTTTDMVRALVYTYWAEKNGENDNQETKA